MKIFIYYYSKIRNYELGIRNYKNNCINSLLLVILGLFIFNNNIEAQTNPIIQRTEVDTSKSKLNMDAVYNRPFLTSDKMPLAVGGYVETNSIYSTEDGVSEGLSFQARRMTLFMAATLAKRIKFLTELEFEDGAKEIELESATVDVVFHRAFNFRGGVVMNPIGAFNQNHDGPRWEFVERPDAAEKMLPATWSNPGFGIYGKTYKGNWILGYEAYITNGFDNSIVNNGENKTFLPAAKDNDERFEESNNGKPLFTGKITIKNRKIGELGVSYMGGIYNKFEEDGIALDEERRLAIFAIDFNTTIKTTGTYIVGEWAFVKLDISDTYTQQYGDKQQGGFIDIVQPVLKRRILDWDKAVINVAARLNYVDWNVGDFKETNTNIGDELFAITPAISFRPTPQTVFRLNYRFQWQKDVLDNPAAKTASWLFGFSTYF